ncbi:MAG: hypothetical protein WC417_01815 [Candidatus Omnitrophota bacterium]
MAIAHMTLLLVVSFFVLLAIGKAGTKGVKTFGYILVALLWLSAAGVAFKGVVSYCSSNCGRMPMMKCGMMMNKQMPCMSMADKPMMDKGMMDKPMMGQQGK